MPVHPYRRFIRCAVALSLLTGSAAAQAPLFSSDPSVVRQQTCFTEQVAAAWASQSEQLQRLREQYSCYMFDYRVGELTVAGHVVIPKTFPGKKLPILIFNRGGNSTTGPLTFSSVMNGHMTWAEHGYIVISSQYRGAKLGGVRGEGQDEFGGRDVDDVMALLPIIDGIPEADATRIGMVGMSRGSIMTYRAVARSRRIKAIAISGGVSDLITELPRRPGMERMLESYIPDFATHREQVLKERSVIYWLDKMDPELPVLLLHGDADKNVAVENATMLAEKLRDKGQPYKLVVYPGGDHGLMKYRRQANDEILAWFKLHLSGKN